MKRILVIDDDKLVLRTFEGLLKRSGFSVDCAEGFDEALIAFRTKEIDLVLSDIRMPGRNGVDAAKEILKELKSVGKTDIPIIFITGYAEMSIELEADFFGEVLYKPVDTEHLLITIREYL